jgi:hypothetical protein
VGGWNQWSPVGGNTVGLVCLGLAGLDLAGHRDPRLWRLYFLIFSDGYCYDGFDFLFCFVFFSDGSCFGYCFLVFHMVPATFRVIKFQKGLNPSKF